MPKGKYAQLTSWSYSVYQEYLKCPMSVLFEKVIRVRMAEPPNPHFEYGNMVHDAAETFVGAPGKPSLKAVDERLTKAAQNIAWEGKPAPVSNLAKFATTMEEFRKAKAATEIEWAFDKKWEPCDWRDWNRAWLRVKTDACMDKADPPLVHIVDYKTGKVHEEHKQQRSLYALAGLLLTKLGKLAGGSKEVQLTAEHLYTNTGQRATEKWAMKDLAPLKREWTQRTKFMMADTTFPAKPGYHCRWCKFRKSAGGPCASEKK